MASPAADPGAPTLQKRGLSSRLVGVVLAGAVLAGCMTGQRPSFESTEPLPTATGNADIDAVLERLDSVSDSVFTAEYSILTKMGNVDSTATVVQARPDRRSITINDVRFLYDDAAVATCDLTTGECEATINDARVSNVSLGHEFYGQSFARRLRVDAGRRVAEPTGYSITQAGQQALCVDVPVTGGTVSYCALAQGALARYDGADLFIEMTGFSDVVDETKFATS
jgi:hypothetical protein